LLKKPLQLNDDFKYVLDLLEKTNKSLFITGRAGTGKSTLLQLFRRSTKKKVVVLAPTGIAALNVQGQTIHSFFKFPAKPLHRSEIKRLRNRKLFKKIDVLIIDEISMVRADLLDNIDFFLRKNREQIAVPFGGVQVVFFGDLFQLPPVIATEQERMLFRMQYTSQYFFAAHVFEQFELEMVELRKIYRQDNRHFIRLLESVRLNYMDYDDLADLNERYLPNYEAEDYSITLSARNATVNRLNTRALSDLDTPSSTYLARIEGSFDPRLYPTELALNLKVGAQVMFIKNDPDRLFVNGTIGKVIELSSKGIKVVIEEGGHQQMLDVPQLEWEILRYEVDAEDETKINTKSIGTFTQYPLKLAWAITIHKSQGKTFEKVIIDLGKGAFEHGQTYVALSRCKTLEGIVLKQKLRPQDILVDEKIVDFYERHF
jgi:ATP-dependent exoDNAse (exonuclease V) alpha subunit